MNVKLLRQIKKIILEKPKKFDMTYWHLQKRKSDGSFTEVIDKPCGTVHCIGGWAQMLSKKEGYSKDVATEVLRLDDQQADRLFRATHWPYRFSSAYYEACDPLKRASIAARRIEHFIKTKGKE